MTNLSPAAQAILDAAKLPSKCYARSIAAAILRAATDQVEPDDGIPAEVQRVLDKLLAIANELDAQP
jgi:hypothetical protein